MQYVVWQLVGPDLQRRAAKATGRTYTLGDRVASAVPGSVIIKPPGPTLAAILARMRN